MDACPARKPRLDSRAFAGPPPLLDAAPSQHADQRARKCRSARSRTRPAAVSSYRRPELSRLLCSNPHRSQRRRTPCRIASPAGWSRRTSICWAVRRERRLPPDTDSKTANSTSSNRRTPPGATTRQIHRAPCCASRIGSRANHAGVRATPEQTSCVIHEGAGVVKGRLAVFDVCARDWCGDHRDPWW
jgi:hypothetical protein